MKLKVFLSKALCIMLCAGMLFSGTVMASARGGEEEDKRYMVILDTPPVYSEDRVTFYSMSDDEYRQGLLELQNDIKLQINGGVSLFSLRRNTEYSYTDILNGFTITTDKQTAEYIKTIDGVSAVVEDAKTGYVLPVGEELFLETFSEEGITESNISKINPGNMMNVSSAYSKGFNGTGRAIAVLDTGITLTNPYYTVSDAATVKYTKSGIENAIATKGLNVSVTADDVYRSAKIPFAYNYALGSSDVSGSTLHGGHVSGIAAGNKATVKDGILSGVAPEAQILFFGVFDEEGGAFTSTIIAAMEDAVKFGVDAINLSLGTDFASENYPHGQEAYKEAIKNAENAGCQVVFATGNSDKGGRVKTSDIDYNSSDNRAYPNSVKVGSVQNEYIYAKYLEDNNGEKYYCQLKGASTAFDFKEIVDCGSGTEEEIKNAGVSGKIAVITRPDTIEETQPLAKYYQNAISQGAYGVVLISNEEYVNEGSLGYKFPAFYVAKSVGEEILSSSSSLKFSNQPEVIKSFDAPRSSGFSSYSYSDSLDITVDYSAPGGNIYSAAYNGFSNLSGTSMAAPQVTGATSLMCQYVEENYPDYTGAQNVRLIKNLLASTATTVYEENGAIASVRKLGAGLINLEDAMSTKIYLTDTDSDRTSITLGADLTDEFDVVFEVHNLSENDITFDNVIVDISTDDYKNYSGTYGFCGIKKLTSSVSGADSILVPANSYTTVSLAVKLSQDDIAYLEEAMLNGFFIDGKVTLSTVDDTHCAVGIPFSGFYGDWGRQPVMTDAQIAEYLRILAICEDGLMVSAIPQKENGAYNLPISPNPAEELADAYVYPAINSLRNSYFTISINNEVVSEGFANKEIYEYHEMSDKTVSDLSRILKNGGGTITIDFKLPYNRTKSAQKIVLNAVADSVVPIIDDVYVQMEDNVKNVYIKTKDNSKISTVTCIGTDDSGESSISDVYVENTGGTIVFDITGLSDINYYIYDSAFNKTELLSKVEITVSGNTAIFTNDTHTDLSGVCMLAVYENNKMTELKMLSEENVDILAYDRKTFDISSYSGKEYKIFFWEDISKTLNPICDAYNQ